MRASGRGCHACVTIWLVRNGAARAIAPGPGSTMNHFGDLLLPHQGAGRSVLAGKRALA
jgi:hypothetical protein